MLITRLSGYLSKLSAGNVKHLSSAASASYIHQRGSKPLKYLNVGQLLDQTARIHPDREALVSCSEDSRITFAETLERVECVDLENQCRLAECLSLSGRSISKRTLELGTSERRSRSDLLT